MAAPLDVRWTLTLQGGPAGVRAELVAGASGVTVFEVLAGAHDVLNQMFPRVNERVPTADELALNKRHAELMATFPATCVVSLKNDGRLHLCSASVDELALDLQDAIVVRGVQLAVPCDYVVDPERVRALIAGARA